MLLREWGRYIQQGEACLDPLPLKSGEEDITYVSQQRENISYISQQHKACLIHHLLKACKMTCTVLCLSSGREWNLNQTWKVIFLAAYDTIVINLNSMKQNGKMLT